MVKKEELHLGQEVLVEPGAQKGIVDGLTQTFAGVILLGGGYGFYRYEELRYV